MDWFSYQPWENTMVIDTDKIFNKVKELSKAAKEHLKAAVEEMKAAEDAIQEELERQLKQQLTDEEVEKLVVRARQVAYDVHSRTGHPADFADFRNAFNEVLGKK
jgi:glutamyl-tRNA reductase